MAEYIEREAAIRMLRGSAVAKYPSSFTLGIFASADELKKLPTADVAQVRHGRWKKSNYHGFLCCSECKDVYIDKTWFGGGKWNYCPNCGAKMDSEATHE